MSGTPAHEIGIPASVIIELGLLLSLDLIKINGWPDEVFRPVLDAFPQIPVTLRAAPKAPVLRLPHGDPYDRIIAATAWDLNATLITKDGNITDSDPAKVIW